MFRNRQSLQKPPDELFERFRQSFPNVANTTTGPDGQPEPVLEPAVVAAPNSRINRPRFSEDFDSTPRAMIEPFRFTPSLTPSAFMDPTSAAFTAFANQLPGLFTPTPTSNFGAGNPLSAPPVATTHSLHTPNIGIILGPSLSLPNGSLSASTSTTAGDFAPQTIQPHQFHTFQPFPQSLHDQYMQYDPRPASGPASPMDLSGTSEILPEAMAMTSPMNGISSVTTLAPPRPLNENSFDRMTQQLPQPSERFRFHVALNAPTAMIRNLEEIPVTYLNKGQAYGITIADTQPPPPGAAPTRYRTYIRISFHDETQRNRPTACWQLWKEGRGTHEAHQRGGKLQAVEFVENQSNGEDEKKKKTKVNLESHSFDGFCVTWSPNTDTAETSVSVRFNFLSTDFSHSKGVKGIPVRLCAKTEVLSGSSPRSSPESATEICYCKVKLFRDHGAERKLSNDIMHVKKTIEKLKQQASQAEGTGMKNFGKKVKKEEDVGKPGKALKHKRTWSVSSASSVNGARAQEEDTNAKLQSMQDMFSSTRPISVLYLPGEGTDDPDLHPVRLQGEHNGDDSWSIHRRGSVATSVSSFVSPTPSSASLSSRRGDCFSPSKDWQKGLQAQPAVTQGDAPMKVPICNEDGVLSGWIKAVGVDTSYKPPAERPPKAVMCVYILPISPDRPEKEEYHRAVYLQTRSARCLSASISAKCDVDPSSVLRTIHMDSTKGISVLVDDDFVDQMNEGQDMKVQLEEIVEDDSYLLQDWSTNGHSSDGSKRWELRIIY